MQRLCQRVPRLVGGVYVDDAGDEPLNDVVVVGGEQHGLSGSGERTQHIDDHVGVALVQSVGRLVQHQHTASASKRNTMTMTATPITADRM